MEIKMITTGQILSENTGTFTPIINRMIEIVGELIPYFIYITIGTLGVKLIWNAVKYIMNYTKTKTTKLFNRDEDKIYDTYEKSDFEKGLEKEGINTLFGEGEIIRTEKNAYKGKNRKYDR